MKGFIVVMSLLLSVNVWAAAHPASAFVAQTLLAGRQIMELKSDDERKVQMCNLLNTRVHSGYIAGEWLGQFANLKRDSVAVMEFRRMIPSILISMAVGRGGNKTFEGSFKVGQTAKARGNGYYAVRVQVTTDNKTYSGTAVVLAQKGKFRVVDVEYLGFSGVRYMGRDYQKKLRESYNRNPNRSMPVSELVAEIKNDTDFIDCSRN